jgi:parvulin-like peptidyl-prolyl isomerase
LRILFLFSAMVACSSPTTPTDAPVGLIDGQPVERSAFVDALMAEHGETFFARYAERMLVERAAKQAGVVVTDDEAARAADGEIETQLTGRFGGSRAQLDEHLARYGQTFDRWRAGRIQDARVMLMAQGVLRGQVDEARVRELFEQRYGKGGVRQQVRHLFISTQVTSTRFYPMSEYQADHANAVKEAGEVAASLHQQLTAGADFAALARAHSDDRTAVEGGVLGSNWSGRYGPRFDDAVRTLPVGQLSPVIESREGFHLLRVDGVRKGARYEGRALLVSARRRSDDDPADEATRFAAAQARAQALLARIQGGEVFADVAKAESADRLTAAKGGDLGPFAPGRLGPEADEVLETMPLNSVSAPIRTKDGFVLIQLTAREFLPAQDKKIVRHIRISTEYPEVKARRLAGKLEALAKAKAEKLFADIQGGAEFATLAREQSEDELSRRTDGAVSGVRVEVLGPESEKILASMKPGEVRLVAGERGFHILKLEAAIQADFAQVRGELEAELRRTPVTEKDARAWIAGLREKAKLEPRF